MGSRKNIGYHMPDLNQQLEGISSLQKRVVRDMEKLSGMCTQVSDQLNDLFRRSFVERKGSVAGMENLYITNNIMKKNAMSARSALGLLKRMRSTTGYDVSEEGLVEQELENIFDR